MSRRIAIIAAALLGALLVVWAAVSAPRPPLPHAWNMQAARESAELERATPCVDMTYNMASYLGALSCTRSDQSWTWERDVDGHSYGVCRCQRAGAP